jgi:hypothetical protein
MIYTRRRCPITPGIVCGKERLRKKKSQAPDEQDQTFDRHSQLNHASTQTIHHPLVTLSGARRSHGRNTRPQATGVLLSIL